MEKLFTDWGSGFQSFVSSFWFFFLPSMCPAGQHSIWSAEGLPSTFGAGDQRADSRWQRAGRQVGWWVAAAWGWAACLLFQCIVAWRSLPQARGSGCQSFSSPWCFASAKNVSSISARSLINGGHAACVCVPVTTFLCNSLDLFSSAERTRFSVGV
jgi:hypothetical protein